MPQLAPAPVRYRLDFAQAHAHLLQVSLRIDAPQAQQLVALPVWIPGSYLVREFAKHLQHLQATQNGHSVAVTQLDKCTWRVHCIAGAPLEISWQMYALDASVRGTWLDAERGCVNGAAVFLRALGCEHLPHALELITPSTYHAKPWRVWTGLSPVTAESVNPAGFGDYLAKNYDELADCPVALLHHNYWAGEHSVAGVPHAWVLSNIPAGFDAAQLLADSQRICHAVAQFWQGAVSASAPLQLPFDRYVFILNTSKDGYGGLEHSNSTVLLCQRSDLPLHSQTYRASTASHPDYTEGYTTLLGLICHEYFHSWNVKRLRPHSLVPYDYGQENYTELLWFFEGFTSYYDDLLLHRAGLMDAAAYLQLLQKTWHQYLQSPGRRVQSAAQASFEAWTKYYRVDENTPNATVSYYAKGALIALCFDLSLRQRCGKSLDQVIRLLWQKLWLQRQDAADAGALTEADFLHALQEISGQNWQAELQAWVHGTDELPVAELLQTQGVAVKAPAFGMQPNKADWARCLGLRVSDDAGKLTVKTVLRGSLAEQAGINPGDEWLATDGWRMHSLADLNTYAPSAAVSTQVNIVMSRDAKLLNLQLPLPQATDWAQTALPQMAIADAGRVHPWLAGTATIANPLDT